MGTTPPPSETPAAPPAEAQPEPAPAAAEVSVTAAAPVEAPVEAPAEEAPPAAGEEAEEAKAEAPEVTFPPITVGAWVRAGARFQGRKPEKLNDGRMDGVYAELHTGGQIHDKVSVTLNFNTRGLAQSAGLMDGIIAFDFMDELHLWAGQLLVPVDRSNASGPFFMIPWYYPGFLTVGDTTVVTAPKEGPQGRNTGAVLWGNFMGGKVKYLAGAFDNGDGSTRPLISGRLTASIVGEEPGFWGNGSFFGDKDVLTIGAGMQYQEEGSVGVAPEGGVAPVDDYGEFNVDLLAEFRYDGGGWVTLEGAYHRFNGDNEAIKNAGFVLAAIATPKVGIGHIQPMVRYQFGSGDDDYKVSQIDASLAYLVKGPGLRVTAGYQRTDLGEDAAGDELIGNSLHLGAQAIFF